MTKVERALVTGARGFIGQRLVHALVARGTDVTCLDRTAAGQDALSGLEVRRVTGDVRYQESLCHALQGAEVVFHLAGTTATRSISRAREVNVQGTWNLAAAAAQQTAPPVFVHVSSLAVAGPSPNPAIETMTCEPVSIYGKTKLEAERTLVQLADRLAVTVVRPPAVYGPGDRNLLSLFKSIQRGWSAYTNAAYRYSFLYVDDLVEMLIVAGHRGQRLASHDDPQRQGVYYAGDPHAVSFPELAVLIAQCLGRARVRQVRIPRVLGWAAANMGELVQRTVGGRIYFNRDKARAYGGSWMCDPTRAREQLQVEPAADLATRLAETTAAYRDAGWLAE